MVIPVPVIIALTSLLQASGPPGDADLPQLVVTVTDGSGRIVEDLDRDDFVLTEDGAPREIVDFVPDSPLSVSVGILIDTSSSMRGMEQGVSSLTAAKGAARVILDLMRPSDEVLLMSFTSGLDVEQRFTEDRQRIDARLRGIDISTGNTNLFGSLDDAFKEVKTARNRARTLVILTDGELNGVFADAYAAGTTDVLEGEVRNTETVVYTMALHHEPVPQMETTIRTVFPFLELLAAASTGRSASFEIHSEGMIVRMTEFVEDMLTKTRGHYTLSYRPENVRPSGLYSIGLKATQPAYQVRFRQLPRPAVRIR
jgi:Ca-activated chloride channel family protein